MGYATSSLEETKLEPSRIGSLLFCVIALSDFQSKDTFIHK